MRKPRIRVGGSAGQDGKADVNTAKVIDEYLYVTVTNKFQPKEMIERWEKWSSP